MKTALRAAKKIRRWGGMLLAAAVFAALPAPVPAHADSVIPEDVYQWVQSTARQSYYFNKQMMHYGVDPDGCIDLDILVIPTLHQYDDIQRQDVIAKRRWRGQSTEGYDGLYGSADYVIINRKEGTVQIKEHQDLDMDWGVLSTENSDNKVSYTDLSDKDVDRKFYESILDYADHNQLVLVERTKKLGILRPQDEKMLEAKAEGKTVTEPPAKKGQKKAQNKKAR